MPLSPSISPSGHNLLPQAVDICVLLMDSMPPSTEKRAHQLRSSNVCLWRGQKTMLNRRLIQPICHSAEQTNPLVYCIFIFCVYFLETGRLMGDCSEMQTVSFSLISVFSISYYVPLTCPVPKDCGLSFSITDLSKTFKCGNTCKATGPDGITSHVFIACADQLAGVFTDIQSLPTCFKMSTLVPVPKKAKVT
jgi:hypothetical protein